MESPEPGVYPNVDFADYSRWDAANFSKLKNMRLTPAHARWLELHPAESTRQQDLGHTIHQALLEPARFEELFLVAPDVDRRTKVGKAEWAAFEERAQGRTIVSESEMECLRHLRANIAGHETANAMLNGHGVSELSLVWIDPETGLLCKGRIDRLAELNGYPFVADVKTSYDPATFDNWQKAIVRYGLHIQAAHYLRGLAVLSPLADGHRRKFAWIVCETQPPYLVRVFEADEEALSIGNDEMVKHLRMYKACLESGVWPAWEQGMSLAGLPAWASKRFYAD
jgi:ATP-dependent exoDNAse (exonuclease V) beta subunit